MRTEPVHIAPLGTLKRDFAEWFRMTLRTHHFSHWDAAWRLGVHEKTASLWAQGRTLPQYPQLCAIRELFQTLPPVLETRSLDEQGRAEEEPG